ncbi:hypothetical protein, partial [Roseateles saccharophilus]
PAHPFVEFASLFEQWAAGPLAYSRWLTQLLDAQTSLWKDMERRTANLWQPLLGPVAAPSAQPLVDAAQGLGLFGPEALQQAWANWAQVWVDALRHDATEA